MPLFLFIIVLGDKMNIGDKLKKARLDKGLTQKKLGDKIGVSQATYQQWESGTRNPKRETLIKIATALEVPVALLYDDYVFKDPYEGMTEEERRREQERMQKQLDLYIKHFDDKKIKKQFEILSNNFNSVNEDGQQKIVDYSSDIADNPKYKKDK